MRALSPRRRTLVSVVASLYAGAFTCVAAALLFELVTGIGAIGHKQLSRTAEAGVIRLSIVLLFAAGLLAFGVTRLRRHGDPRLIAWPLGFFAVVGSIGEIIDLAGSASEASNAIGAGLIIMAAIPVGLILWDR